EPFLRKGFWPLQARFYRTGDLARWQPDGNIVFLGRIDHQVKIRGFRIELGEIENGLLTHPEIKEAVVLCWKPKTGDNFLCAYYVPGNAPPLESGLQDFLSQTLPDYMIPSFFIKLEEIPLTLNGKINRKALLQLEISHTQLHTHTPPANDTEKKLAKIWGDLLEMHEEKISVKDDFFRIGGHSLKATIMAARVHKEFNVKLPLAQIFKTPSLRGLANTVKGLTKEKYAAIEPIEKKDYYILSSAQKRLYVLQQMEQESTAYNMPYITPLSENISPETLEKTFRKLIARHESLRTSFHIVNGEPVQVIQKNADFEIERKQDSINNFCRPFDLTHAPLIRAAVMETKDNKKNMLIDMHHIITDGTSQEVLIMEFYRLNKGANLTPLKLQYKDYAEWQNSIIQKQLTKRQEEYWLKLFPGELPILYLPTDYPRPAIQSFEGDEVKILLTKQETANIKEIAKENKVTLYMTVLSIFTILLSKLSGQEDIIVGTPTAGRRHADLDEIVGMFVNTLAMRNYPEGEKTFEGFLEEVKENTLHAFENQEYQFEDLVDRLRVKRDTGRNPVFDIIFGLINKEEGEFKGPIEAVPTQFKTTTAKFDLGLNAFDNGNELVFVLDYCTKLFKKETIMRFSEYLRGLVTTITAESGEKIKEIEIITAAEKKQLLNRINDTKTPYPEDKTIHRLFEDQVRKTPANISLVGPFTGGRREQMQVTYKELNERAGIMARHMQGRGVVPGTIVGILAEPSVGMLIGLLGILKAGGAYLPMDPAAPRERIAYMLADSNTKILLTDNTAKLAHLGNTAKTVSTAEKTGTTKTALGRNIEIIDILIAAGKKNGGAEAGGATVEVDPGEASYIIYTSGSTGVPKGVLISHRNAVVYICGSRERLNLAPGDTRTQTSAVTFDHYVEEVYPQLSSGGKLVIVPEEETRDISRLAEVLERHRVTVMSTTPAVLKLLSEHRLPGHLRCLITGGDTLTRDQIAEIPAEIPIYNYYGPTEATVSAACYVCPPVGEIDEASQTVPIGKPMANYRIYILDRYEKAVPTGVKGEICIAGNGLALGYLNNPELTAERFINHKLQAPNYKQITKNKIQITNKKQKAKEPEKGTPSQLPGTALQINAFGDVEAKCIKPVRDGRKGSEPPEGNLLYRTGDLGRWLPDGNIEFLGRIDLQVKIRGFRIELGEIENSILKHPEIKEAAAIVRQDSDGDNFICAY
ncbi:MAG: amino acid adenylation domain-containing protein, partial [bacterium]|nr:amino acid adenylation domain-containing protein [bacterium]